MKVKKINQEVKQKLDQKYKQMKELSHTFAGYPCNADFDYHALYRFLSMPINNVGDALTQSNYQINTHDFELEVLRMMAKLYGENEDFWGYVTNGGSEGNLCGLHFARTIYPDAIVFYSKHSHYSVEKAIRITRSHGFCIDVLSNGEINYDELEAAIEHYPHLPIIMMANLGTTMTGAIDDIKRIRQIFEKHEVTRFYIHADAALHGFIIPFAPGKHKINFSLIDSIAISGHKLLGSPLPCGIFLTHSDIAAKQMRYIEYVDIHDASISGSRNAFTPLIIWYRLKEFGEQDIQLLVTKMLQLTNYMVEKLNSLGIPAWANVQSPIVIFPKPSERVVQKWELACYEAIAHVVVMPHVTQVLIDQIILDLLAEHAPDKHTQPMLE